MCIQNKKKKMVMHFITTLGEGGSEGVLYRLCLHDKLYEHKVISLTSVGKYGNLLIDKGFEVHSLNLKKGTINISSILKIRNLLKQEKPDIIQNWMYHSDFLIGLISYFMGLKNIFWNIRNTKIKLESSSFKTLFLAIFNAIISYFIPKK